MVVNWKRILPRRQKPTSINIVATSSARGNIRRSWEHAEAKAEGDGSELEVFLPRGQKPTSIKCSSHELSSWEHTSPE
ncbi:MAG: hypothetical protein ACI923_001425, partial [Flavobacteriales bacterium]